MRDSQRQKLYDAERAAPQFAIHRIEEVPSIQEFLNRITKSAWFRKRNFRWSWIKCTDGRRRRCGGACGNRIMMPKFSRSKMYILHEVAHCLQPHGTAWHGREFCKIYLALVKKWVSPEAAEELKSAFKSHRVKYVTGSVKV